MTRLNTIITKLNDMAFPQLAVKATVALAIVLRTSLSSDPKYDPLVYARAAIPTSVEIVPQGSIRTHLVAGTAPYYAMDNAGTWTQFALVGGTNDFAVTATAADELVNVDLSMVHATAQGVGIDAHAIQLTTARSSGNMIGVRSKTTSLAGDSGGVYSDFWASTPTDGGGTNTHVAFYVGTGHDRLLDLSTTATANNLVVVPSNVADAWTFGNGTLVYSKLVTTAATPGWVHTFTHTSAGQASSTTGSINSATAAYSAITAAAVQLSTSRTAGQVNAFSATSTSLAGDSNSVLYVGYNAATPTDGGGTVKHVAFKAANGHDIAFDASSMLTAQDVYAIPTNVADGFNLYDLTTSKSYIKAVTTTGSESIAVGVPLTTTDGVSAGTAKTVGGRYTNSLADSTGIAQASSGYSSFDVTASILANTLKAGTRLKIRAVVRISVALNGGATVEGIKLRLGTQTLITVHGSTAGAADTRCVIECELTARAAPGASIGLSAFVTGAWSDTVAKITVGAPAGVLVFATTGALAVDLQASTSAAGDASGRIVLENLYTEVI